MVIPSINMSEIERILVQHGLASPSAPSTATVAPTAPATPNDLASDASLPPVPEIPAATGDYKTPDWFDVLQLSLTDSDMRGACLFGPRGTGKTTAVRHAAALAGVPLVTFQAGHGMTLEDIAGMRDLVNGNTVFTPGPLLEALIHDCWIVMEEVNVMHPGTFSPLNTLLDGSGTKYRAKDGKRYSVGDRFRVVLCFNEGAAYAGTREVNAALKDRLAPIYTAYLPEAEEIEMLVSRTSIDTDSARRIVRLANGLRVAGRNLGFDLSPRALMRLIKFKRSLSRMSWMDAFTASVLNLVGDPHEKGPQRGVLKNVADVEAMYAWPDPVFSK